MTARKPARHAAEQQAAGPDASPAADAVPVPAAAGGAAESAAQAEAGAAAPDDAQQLEAEIEQTREQLGETVEQLAAKADLRSRARAKVAGLTGQLKNKTAAARQKAISTGSAGKDQLQARAAAIASPVRQATPDPVRQTVARGTAAARQRAMPLAAAAAVIVGFLLIRRWRKR